MRQSRSTQYSLLSGEGGGSGLLSGWTAGLAIGRPRVRIPKGAAGEFSSPELTFSVDSYLISVPPACYRSGTEKSLIILPKAQVTP